MDATQRRRVTRNFYTYKSILYTRNEESLLLSITWEGKVFFHEQFSNFYVMFKVYVNTSTFVLKDNFDYEKKNFIPTNRSRTKSVSIWYGRNLQLS